MSFLEKNHDHILYIVTDFYVCMYVSGRALPMKQFIVSAYSDISTTSVFLSDPHLGWLAWPPFPFTGDRGSTSSLEQHKVVCVADCST